MKPDTPVLTGVKVPVSIPERVLEALKHLRIPVCGMPTAHQVSIPERVLEALKLSLRIILEALYSVSIPERVLEALKRVLQVPEIGV